MRVLVAAASRHGATAEIAVEIGVVLAARLRDAGLPAEVDVRGARTVRRVAGYQAVVLGSAVYQGQWLEPAHRLVAANRADLAVIPVWLFSSGPVGDPPVPAGDPDDVPGLCAAVGAYGHRVFPGRLRRRGLGPLERLVVAALAAPEGDYRDWPAVRRWAGEIGGILSRRAGVTDPDRQPVPPR
jgi:menaquinone-dependent protoporphyrinogen oxidase